MIKKFKVTTETNKIEIKNLGNKFNGEWAGPFHYQNYQRKLDQNFTFEYAYHFPDKNKDFLYLILSYPTHEAKKIKKYEDLTDGSQIYLILNVNDGQIRLYNQGLMGSNDVGISGGENNWSVQYSEDGKCLYMMFPSSISRPTASGWMASGPWNKATITCTNTFSSCPKLKF